MKVKPIQFRFLDFRKLMCLLALRKTGQIDFLENELRLNYLLPVSQILRNCTEGHARKFTDTLVLLFILMLKNTDVFSERVGADYLSFKLSVRAIVKL